jgi:tetratricopeptide (TPR) repeat protein
LDIASGQATVRLAARFKGIMPVNRLVAGFGVALSTALVLSAQTEFESSFQQGAGALRAGRLDDAAAAFTRSIAANPAFAEPYFDLGLVRLQQNRADDAATLFSKALQLKPGLRGGELFLGIAQCRIDQYEQAAGTLRKAIASEPANSQALLWLGIAELSAGRATQALAPLQKAAQLKPDDADVLYHLGRAYMEMSKDTYQHMYEADPHSWRVHQVLCNSFQQADRLDDAVKECQLAIDSKPNEPGLHLELGEVYWKQNHLEQAEAEFQRELDLNPQDFTAMYKLGAISIERSKPDVGKQLLTRVLEKHPESREAHYQRGRAEAQLGDNQAAITDFAAVISGSGAADPEMNRQSYYQLAQLYRRTQQPEQARLALSSFRRLKEQADLQQQQKLEDKLKRSKDTVSQ